MFKAEKMFTAFRQVSDLEILQITFHMCFKFELCCLFMKGCVENVCWK